MAAGVGDTLFFFFGERIARASASSTLLLWLVTSIPFFLSRAIISLESSPSSEDSS